MDWSSSGNYWLPWSKNPTTPHEQHCSRPFAQLWIAGFSSATWYKWLCSLLPEWAKLKMSKQSWVPVNQSLVPCPRWGWCALVKCSQKLPNGSSLVFSLMLYRKDIMACCSKCLKAYSHYWHHQWWLYCSTRQIFLFSWLCSIRCYLHAKGFINFDPCHLKFYNSI